VSVDKIAVAAGSKVKHGRWDAAFAVVFSKKECKEGLSEEPEPLASQQLSLSLILESSQALPYISPHQIAPTLGTKRNDHAVAVLTRSWKLSPTGAMAHHKYLVVGKTSPGVVYEHITSASRSHAVSSTTKEDSLLTFIYESLLRNDRVGGAHLVQGRPLEHVAADQ